MSRRHGGHDGRDRHPVVSHWLKDGVVLDEGGRLVLKDLETLGELAQGDVE